MSSSHWNETGYWTVVAAVLEHEEQAEMLPNRRRAYFTIKGICTSHRTTGGGVPTLRRHFSQIGWRAAASRRRPAQYVMDIFLQLCRCVNAYSTSSSCTSLSLTMQAKINSIIVAAHNDGDIRWTSSSIAFLGMGCCCRDHGRCDRLISSSSADAQHQRWHLLQACDQIWPATPLPMAVTTISNDFRRSRLRQGAVTRNGQHQLSAAKPCHRLVGHVAGSASTTHARRLIRSRGSEPNKCPGRDCRQAIIAAMPHQRAFLAAGMQIVPAVLYQLLFIAMPTSSSSSAGFQRHPGTVRTGLVLTVPNWLLWSRWFPSSDPG